LITGLKGNCTIAYILLIYRYYIYYFTCFCSTA